MQIKRKINENDDDNNNNHDNNRHVSLHRQ